MTKVPMVLAFATSVVGACACAAVVLMFYRILRVLDSTLGRENLRWLTGTRLGLIAGLFGAATTQAMLLYAAGTGVSDVTATLLGAVVGALLSGVALAVAVYGVVGFNWLVRGLSSGWSEAD
jgi:hypothetical protein